MKTFLVIALSALMLVSVVLPTSASIWCKYARYNPGFATICFWEMMMDTWNVGSYFDDGDADDYGNG